MPPVVFVAIPSEGLLGQPELPFQLVVSPLSKPYPLGLDLGEDLGGLRDTGNSFQLSTGEAPESQGPSTDLVR